MSQVKLRGPIAAALGVVAMAAAPAEAYLFWSQPAIGGAPVTGDGPGVAQALPGATAAEQRAGLVWTMRAGLNVAALQCQFAPALRTVANYNNMLRQHSAELQSSYGALTAYFKRTSPKSWATTLDQYTTRTYNSFSTLNAQIIFCETAASIGRETMDRPRGQLATVASERLREFRNSLTPAGDAAFAANMPSIGAVASDADLAPQPCTDKKGRIRKC